MNLDLIKGFQGEDFDSTDGSVHLGSLSVTPHGITSLNFSYGISADDVVLVPDKNRQLLGKGAGGFVWRALDRRSGKMVAVKEVCFTSGERQKEIRQELEALFENDCQRSSSERGAPIGPRCPHIVDFFGAYYHEGAVCMVLECMHGSLDRLPFPAPPPVLASITRQIVKGLRYLHEQRHFIHRDLKPSNILFYTSGEVKLSDFGISSHLEGSTDNRLTFVGTLTCMSPERLKGEEHSYAADIWSLGLIVCEMALGTHPYQPILFPSQRKETSRGSSRFTTEQLFWKLLLHLSEDNEHPVVSLPVTMDPLLAQFIEACLQKVPGQRPNCEALLRHPFLAQVQPEEEDAARFQAWMKGHPPRTPMPRPLVFWPSSKGPGSPPPPCEREEAALSDALNAAAPGVPGSEEKKRNASCGSDGTGIAWKEERATKEERPSGTMERVGGRHPQAHNEFDKGNQGGDSSGSFPCPSCTELKDGKPRQAKEKDEKNVPSPSSSLLPSSSAFSLEVGRAVHGLPGSCVTVSPFLSSEGTWRTPSSFLCSSSAVSSSPRCAGSVQLHSSRTAPICLPRDQPVGCPLFPPPEGNRVKDTAAISSSEKDRREVTTTSSGYCSFLPDTKKCMEAAFASDRVMGAPRGGTPPRPASTPAPTPEWEGMNLDDALQHLVDLNNSSRWC